MIGSPSPPAPTTADRDRDAQFTRPRYDRRRPAPLVPTHARRAGDRDRTTRYALSFEKTACR